jgi:hypothetical protein
MKAAEAGKTFGSKQVEPMDPLKACWAGCAALLRRQLCVDLSIGKSSKCRSFL